MPPKKDLCRNFQRGSCQYGERCRFLHSTPQQQKTNPFGFGTPSGSQFQQTNQQQPPNPFGFGVQNNNSQSSGANVFGSRPNQPKPFENTWTRSSSLNTSKAPASRQPESQQQAAANHKCTDPESCKRIIAEDFEKEKPLWKLTCYGHNKNGPCDVIGDISYEELRALAYDEAKQGKSLQFIIDRERSLQNSKLAEFENLLRKPYQSSSAATLSTQNPIAFGVANTPTLNTSFSSPASTFGQLNASLNTGPTALPNYAFGQPIAAQNNVSQPSNSFQTSPSPFSNPANLSNSNSADTAQKNPFSNLASSSAQQTQQTGNSFAAQSYTVFNGLNSAPGAFGQPSMNTVFNGLNSAPSAFGQPSVSLPSTDSTLKENSNVDAGMWNKAEWRWNIGEIPEDAPPDVYIH